MRKRKMRARAKIHAVGAVLTAAAFVAMAGVAGGFNCGTLTVLEAVPWVGSALVGAWCGVRFLNT